MFTRIAVRLVTYLLKRIDLSVEEQNTIVIHILDNIRALPLSDTIYISTDGQLLVRNRPLDMEQMRLLRESARAALENHALTLIREQVTFEAITMGVHRVDDPKQMLFARAALWWGNEVEKKLLLLAQRAQEPSLE